VYIILTYTVAICILPDLIISIIISFSALTLLVGWKEGHLAC